MGISTMMPGRLGRWNSALIFGGMVMLLATTVSLSFLWFGGDNTSSSSSSSIWHAIVLKGWLIRTVTILSLVIRATVAAQVLVCVSMLASLALEHGHAPLHGAAAISMMRFQNGGAFSFLGNISWSPKSVGGSLLVVTSAVLAVIAVGLQFTSTALLSDLGPGFVLLPMAERQSLGYALSVENPNSKAISMSTARARESGNHIHNKPGFPVFAEYAETPSPRDQTDGISDTGLSMRAFLPLLSPSSRMHLREYTGPATVFDARVVCLRPDMDNTVLNFRYHTPPPQPDVFPLIAGRVASSLRPRRRFTGSAGGEFNCSYSAPDLFAPDAREWPVSLCANRLFQEPLHGTVSDMEPFPVQGRLTGGDNSQKIEEEYLVINATGTPEDWSAILTLPRGPNMNSSSTANWTQLVADRGEGEWLHLKTTNASSTVGFSISLCYSAFHYMVADVHANTTTTTPLFEPFVTWNTNQTFYDTSQARRQLVGSSSSSSGNTNNGPEERGILRLTPLASWLAFNETGHFNSTPRFPTQALAMRISEVNNRLTQTLSVCSSCDCGNCRLDRPLVSNINAVQAAVVNQVLSSTRNAARGIQSLLTMLAAQAYYDQAELFDLVGQAETRSIVEVIRPVKSTFFAVVVVLVAVHISIVMAVVVLFLKRTENTVLGDAWRVVAQLRGDDKIASGKKYDDILSEKGASSDTGDARESWIRGGGDFGEEKLSRRGTFVKLVRRPDGLAVMKKCI